MSNDQGDVILQQTPDDGEITVVGGVVAMGGGLETAAYLSMFGGNEDSSRPWWGNLQETEPARQYTAETQSILRSLPAVSGNLIRVKEAVESDLAWMIPDVANLIEVAVSLINLNRVGITIQFNGDQTLKFVENWEASF